MQDKRTEKYAQMLSRMIAIKTVSCGAQGDKSTFYSLRELLRELFPNLFRSCELEDFDGSFALHWKGRTDALPIMLMNHQDVVDADADEKWSHSPYSGEIADGRIWGRGTIDDKGGLWAMLCAADELISEGFVPSRDIYLVSSCTEETDGSGANSIAQKYYERALRFASVLDEGGMMVKEPIAGAQGVFAMIGVGEKGCVDLKFVARSNGGHASTPEPNTPLVRLGKFMALAEKKNLFKAKISPTVHATFNSIASKMNTALGFVLRHSKFFGPILVNVMPKVSATAGAMLKTTVAFTMAEGSSATNVLPQCAFVIANMRFSHHQGREDSINAIKKLAEKFDIETEILDFGFESPISDYKSDSFASLGRTINKIFPNVSVTPYIMTGASDCRYMTKICDNCFRFSPFVIDDEQLASVHGTNENIELSSLAPAVDFYRLYIKEA